MMRIDQREEGLSRMNLSKFERFIEEAEKQIPPASKYGLSIA
jgi:hypothetical protein